MPDIANHDELRGAFVDLEEYVMPQVMLPGSDHALATVRRRRAVRTALASVAAALVIASAATFAATRAARPEPGVSATSSSPSTSVPVLPMRLLSDHMKPTPLDRASLNLPDFHHSYCPKGQTQFYDRRWSGPGVADVFEASAVISDIVEGDVTGDGHADRIALITCNAGTDPGGYAAQVVAYTDAGSLLGQVTWVSGGREQLQRPQVVDGKLQVLYVSTPDAAQVTAVQLRAFAWNGSRFTPAGTTPVPIDQRPTQLTLTGELTRFSGDIPRATLTLRVTNRSGLASDALTIAMSSGAPLTVSLAGTTLNSLEAQGGGDEYYGWIFTIAGVPPGATVEGTFDVTAVTKALIGPNHLAIVAYAIGPAGLPLDNALDANADLIVSR